MEADADVSLGPHAFLAGKTYQPQDIARDAGSKG
jgi:hypothetical protein